MLVAALAACLPPGDAPPASPNPTGAPVPAEPAPPPWPTGPPALASPPDCAKPCRGRPRRIGQFDVGAAPEASGIAASRRNRGVLYVLDDGPGTTSLLAISAKNGRMLRRLPVAGLEGVDTESLAVAPCGGGSCIYIGDIGDNATSRDAITITRVREPDVDRDIGPLPAAQATWRYPGAPADAEALLASPDGTFGVVTKDPGGRGRGAARLYLAAAFEDLTLDEGSRVRLPRPSSPMASAILGTVVTGGEASAGGVVLRTYDAVFEFRAPRPGAPLREFPSWPVAEVAAPAEVQGEAITYAADGCGLFTVGEGSGAVTSIPCRSVRP